MKRSLRGNNTDNAVITERENKNAEEMIKEYSRMSDDELMRELMFLTEKQKNDGTFDIKSVLEGVKALEPMLNDEQKAKLSTILERL